MNLGVPSRDETVCAAPGCTNPVVRNPRGRPASYCSPACRSATYRSTRRRADDGPVRVEVAHGSTSSKGRPAGRVWMVRMVRGDRSVIVSCGLGRISADSLARKIAELISTEEGAID